MRKWQALNARQLEVLRWVASGEDLRAEAAVKVSARALHDRGLIVVSRRGGAWSAEVTDAGRFYLAHGHHPDRPGATSPARNAAEPESVSTGSPSPKVAKLLPPHATARVAAERRAAATDLVAKLVEKKRVVISRPDEDEIAEWRKVVDFAKRHMMVPAGYRIEKTRRHGTLYIGLIEGSHPNAKPPLDPAQHIEVPEQIDRLHPLLAHLQDPASVLNVSQQMLPRALRIMHAVLTEAERRGYETGWAEDSAAGAEIRVDGMRFQLTLSEERDVRDVLPTPDELASRKVYAWQRIQPEEKTMPSGRLRLELDGGGRWDRSRYWADRQRWRLEGKLVEVLAEVDTRVQAERDRLPAEEEAKQQRQRDWEVAMARARAQFQEDRRIAKLNKQLKRWEAAAKIRAYCAALEQAVAVDHEPVEAEAASWWREWCRSYADSIDPVQRGAVAPAEVEPDPSDLKPYLGRWSPYGP